MSNDFSPVECAELEAVQALVGGVEEQIRKLIKATNPRDSVAISYNRVGYGTWAIDVVTDDRSSHMKADSLLQLLASTLKWDVELRNDAGEVIENPRPLSEF